MFESQFFAHVIELGVAQGFAWQNALSVVLHQHFIQKVYCLEVCEVLVVVDYERRPWFTFLVRDFV